MLAAKVRIKIGAVEFEGEGDQKWLGEQLEKVLEKAPELSRLAPDPAVSSFGGPAQTAAAANGDPGTLPAFIKKTNGNTSQTKKFLAVAGWLMRKGKNRLATKDVTTALGDHHQARLRNASQSLAENVKKGHCEKDGRNFYVTPDGFKELGE